MVWPGCWHESIAAALRLSVQGRVLEEFQAGLKTGQWKRAKEIQQWLAPGIK